MNVVGATSPTMREIGDDLMLSDNLVIVADCLAAVKLESGMWVQIYFSQMSHFIFKFFNKLL